MNKERLDLFLVKHKYCESRNKAQALIEQGLVLLNNKIITKANYEISINDQIEIIESLPYVSRAGYKIEAAIKAWDIDLKNKIVLDIGASTGGFTDCCLQHGAQKVYSLDVGHDQLHPTLKSDTRVIDLSPFNIKDLKQNSLNDTIDIVVSDLSFISSKFMFEAISHINLASQAIIISLIKPQFELTPAIVAKHNGVIKEKKFHDEAINKVIQYAQVHHFKNIAIIPSPIKGAKKNNTEFLGLFVYEQ